MAKLLLVLALGAGLLFGALTKTKAEGRGPGVPVPPPCPKGVMCATQ